MSNIRKIRDEVTAVLLDGQNLAVAWAMQYNPKALPPNLSSDIKNSARGIQVYNDYQRWYSKALQIVSQLLTSRKEDFMGLYEFKGNRKNLNYSNYRIADGLRGYMPGGVRS